MKAKDGYDFNTLLIIANFVVCTIAVFLFCVKDGNQYVDIYTIILLCIFGLQNFLILLWEKKKRDPFILILMVVVLVFYMARVVTLLYDPWSIALEANSITADGLNFTMFLILFYNASIFFGLIAAGGNVLYKNDKFCNVYPANPLKIAVIFLIVIAMGFYISLASDIIGRFAGYITGVFIKLHLVILFTFVYLLINAKRISASYLIVFAISFLIFIVFYTLHGSRAALLTLAYLLLIASIAVKGRIRFSKKTIIFGAVLIPISVIMFLTATYIRATIPSSQIAVSSQHLNILKKSNIFDQKDIKIILRPIFDRMGFLDYSAVVITNREKYSKIFNFRYYFKSVIDNVFTPGFNVFGTPKASNSMSYISRGEEIPTHKDITAAYQSNMPTVYGENHVLFHGYPALVILFVFSFFFKKIYLSIRSRDMFFFYLYRALALYIFYLWLNSFALDWMVYDLLGIAITVWLFKNFYKMKKSKLKPSIKENVLVGESNV